MSRAALAVLLVSATAAADPVAIKVVDVAGGAAYLTPGRAAGIAPGTTVRLHGTELVVVEVTETTAMVRIGGARIAIGDTGTAEAIRGAAAVVRLDPPRPAEAFAGQWSDPVPPATQQTPRSVPLGAARRATGARASVIGHAFATTGRGGSSGDAELRVVAAYDAMPERP
ncbi:MAG TPA: hypothetical protein VK607_17475, partial [Kofleriaceae bacterium]|nr:hypothetical protein [Kofleriaceae bacterium]